MEKPVSVIINELTQNIIDDLNQSQLHPSILVYVMNDINKMVQDQANKTVSMEMQQYNAYLNEEKKDEKEEVEETKTE